MYLGLWLWTKEKKSWGAVLAGVGLEVAGVVGRIGVPARGVAERGSQRQQESSSRVQTLGVVRRRTRVRLRKDDDAGHDEHVARRPRRAGTPAWKTSHQ